MNIILGISGSVASTISHKLMQALSKDYTVDTVITNSSKYFIDRKEFNCVYDDEDEWFVWNESKKVLHVELRKKANALVIAPLSMNTLAKISNGICDNLLTCLVRAWDNNRPIIFAPAANTFMYKNDMTMDQIDNIKKYYPNSYFVTPIEKKLACGDFGIGAMAKVEDIVETLKKSLKWYFPLESTNYVPVGDHPGAFGVKRKYDNHTGVDLYCNDNDPVYAVENGVVVAIEDFTGPKDNTPWWNDTKCVLVEGASGVVNYGEVTPLVNVGDVIKVENPPFALVKQVLKKGKKRNDIPHHSLSMLHIELYEHGTRESCSLWEHDSPTPTGLLDPTKFLLESLK